MSRGGRLIVVERRLLDLRVEGLAVARTGPKGQNARLICTFFYCFLRYC
jgi:hypothetical protein